MDERKPAVGDMVHYISYGTPGGDYKSECRAAVVAKIWSTQDVDLVVFNPEGLFFNRQVRFNVPENRGGTWHWPETA